MSEVEYLRYCRGYCAQMGMPFDERMVIANYRAICAQLGGGGGPPPRR
jgi:hypothetical protein